MSENRVKAVDVSLDQVGRVVLSDAELAALCDASAVTFAGGAGFNGVGCSNEANCGNTVNQTSCTNSAGACEGNFNANGCWNKEAGQNS